MTTTSSSTFGALLRRRRLVAGLTQEELAERAGLSARGVQDLERGVRLAPRPETVRLLVDALQLSAEARDELIKVDDRHEEAVTHFHLGIVSYGQRDFPRAEAECLAARVLAREVGNRPAGLMAAVVLAHVAIAVGDLRQAASWYREVLAITEDFGGFVFLWERGRLEGPSQLVAGVALLSAAQGAALRSARLFGMAEAARALIGLVPTLP
jgi:transcriptional regulator with XRE-family HTH domain